MHRPGIEPGSSAWEAEILTDGPPVLIVSNNKCFKNMTLKDKYEKIWFDKANFKTKNTR